MTYIYLIILLIIPYLVYIIKLYSDSIQNWNYHLLDTDRQYGKYIREISFYELINTIHINKIQWININDRCYTSKDPEENFIGYGLIKVNGIFYKLSYLDFFKFERFIKSNHNYLISLRGENNEYTPILER